MSTQRTRAQRSLVTPSKEPTQLATPSSAYMPGVGPGDLRPPEYRLLQGQSSATQDGLGRPGQFYSPQSGEAIDKLEGVVINIQKTRTLWTEEELKAPRCSSNDSIVARSGAEFEGRVCAQCPLANTSCRPGYTLTMLKAGQATLEALCLIRLGTPTAMTAVQNYLTALWTAFERTPFHAYTVIEAVQRKNNFGTFFVPIPRATAQEGAILELRETYAALAEEFAARSQGVAEALDSDDNPSAPATIPGQGGRRGNAPLVHGPEVPRGPAGNLQGDLF